MAVVDKPGYGIQFGAEGLTIPLAQQAPRAAKCRWQREVGVWLVAGSWDWACVGCA